MTATNVLICDCDGVLIDSEAVAADVLVRELDARWPGADARPAVMPLLGLRIERVLAGACDALGRTLSNDDVAETAPRSRRRPSTRRWSTASMRRWPRSN